MRGIFLSILLFAISFTFIPSIYAETVNAKSIAFEETTIIEFTNDGKIDFAITTTSGKLILFENLNVIYENEGKTKSVNFSRTEIENLGEEGIKFYNLAIEITPVFNSLAQTPRLESGLITYANACDPAVRYDEIVELSITSSQAFDDQHQAGDNLSDLLYIQNSNDVEGGRSIASFLDDYYEIFKEIVMIKLKVNYIFSIFKFFF